jgi:DNA replication protein DnaC
MPEQSLIAPPLPDAPGETHGSELRYRAEQLGRKARLGDEVAARELVSLAGVTVARHGAAEVESAVHRAMGATLPGVPPLHSLGGSLPSARSREAFGEDAEPVEHEPPACAWCADHGSVRVTGDPDDSRFGIAVPCTHCRSIEQRLAVFGVDVRYQSAAIDTMVRHGGNALSIDSARAWDGRRSVVIASRFEQGDAVWGVGKTTLACAMLRRVVEARGVVRFVSTMDMLGHMKGLMDVKGDGPQGYALELAREPILMLDDLGAERATPYAVETVRVLLDDRYRRTLTTIITTNMTMAEVFDTYGGYLASRLKEFDWWLVGGSDFRGGTK